MCPTPLGVAPVEARFDPGRYPGLVFDATRDAPRLDALAAHLGGALDPDVRAACARFAALAGDWARRTDLVGARDATDLAEQLFGDALVVAREELVPPGARVVDVGTGAGTPGIGLSLLRPDLDVLLVEPRRKRVAFLRTAIGTLGLRERVRVLEARVGPGTDLGALDVAVSRATFPPERWLPLALELAPRALVLTAAPPGLPGVVSATVAYTVASTGAPRCVTAYDRG